MLRKDLLVPASQAQMTNSIGNLETAIQAQTGIWVPNNAEEVQLQTIGREELIAFPRGEAPSRPIMEWNWHLVTDTRLLLDSFIKVESPKQALRFARTWGPLWLLGENERGEGEFWDGRSLRQIEVFREGKPLKKPVITYGPTPWIGSEPVEAWLAFARRARATVHVAALVRSDQIQKITEQLWKDVGWSTRYYDKRKDTVRRMLVRVINAHLTNASIGSRLRLDDDLNPVFHTGLGFLAAVWWEIAQIAAGVQAFYVCASCLELHYLERGERARTNPKRIFCEKCRTDNRLVAKAGDYRSKRTLLLELVAFVRSRLPSDIDIVRIAWNDEHDEPESRIDSNAKLRKKLTQALSGSYHALNEQDRRSLREELIGLAGFVDEEAEESANDNASPRKERVR